MSRPYSDDEPFPNLEDLPTAKYPPYLQGPMDDAMLDSPPMRFEFREPEEKKKVPKYVEALASIIATLIILGIGAIAILFLVSIIIQILGRMF